MKKFRNFTLVMVIIVLSSLVLKAQDASEKARTLTPKADKALVYVLRASGYAFALRFPVNVDGKPIATLGTHDFGFISLDAGKHQLQVVNGTSKASLLDVDLEAGKVYYYAMEIKMGAVTGRGVLKLVKEDDGKKDLKKCELAKNNQEQL